MTKEHLAELLNSTLPAGATRDQLHQQVRDLQELTAYLAHALATQGRSILEIRDMLVEPSIEPVPELIGFEEPKIVMPRKN